MNILFNASGCGLCCGGGSKTIIKSAETLKKMGHNVAIWSPINNYTWHVPTIEILKSHIFSFSSSHSKKLIVVNVSVWDVDSTLLMSVENKVWWLRGWEKWVKGEAHLIKMIKRFVSAGGRMIVNATHLKDKLEKIGVESTVCFAGLDLDFWNDDFKAKCGVGSLGPSKHKTKNYSFCRELETYLNIGRAYEDQVKWNYVNGDLNNELLYKLYNQCRVWFAPTVLEGFHQMSAEANLCGSLVYCNREDSNGMHDYATDDTAMRYSSWDELTVKINYPDYSKIGKMQDVLRNKIGNRSKNMKRFVEVIG